MVATRFPLPNRRRNRGVAQLADLAPSRLGNPAFFPGAVAASMIGTLIVAAVSGLEPAWLTAGAVCVIAIVAVSRGPDIARLADAIEGLSEDSIYGRRRSHFKREKAELGEAAQSALSRICRELRKRHEGVVVVLDSGTTIAQVVRQLTLQGITNLSCPEEVRFVTNSLAGAREFARLAHGRAAVVPEEGFDLVGGSPLSTYRAVTGARTLDELRRFCHDARRKNWAVVGVLTSNWIIVGGGCDKLELCARGRGHGDVKKLVADLADQLIVVAPLGKLVAVNAVGELNDLMRSREPHGERYSSIEVTGRASTEVLTTTREDHPSEPLRALSREFHDPLLAPGRPYELSPECFDYSAPFPATDDLPHRWTWRYAAKLFKAA